MSLIDGQYELHRDCGAARSLTIALSGNEFAGTEGTSAIDGVALQGSFDPASYAVAFSDQQEPNEVFGVTHYTGFAVSADGTTPCYLAGTYTETVLSGWPHAIRTTVVQRGWYATFAGRIPG